MPLFSEACSNKGTNPRLHAASPCKEDSETQGDMRPPTGFRRIAMFQVSGFVIFPLTAFHPSSSV